MASTRRLRPAAGVHVAWHDGDLVFLDLASGQYGGAGPELAAAVLWAFAPRTASEPKGAAELLQPLLGSLLVVASDDSDPYMPALAVGERRDAMWRPVGGDAIDHSRPTTLRRTATATWFLRRADRTLRRFHAGTLIRELTARQRRAGLTVDRRGEQIPSLLEAHVRARMLYPRTTFCLAGAAALAAHAWALGIAVSFVIGVQAKPFYAHAWVEFDGGIVSDHPEAGHGLAPILTLG